MVTFPDNPKDGDTVIDKVDDYVVIVWTYSKDSKRVDKSALWPGGELRLHRSGVRSRQRAGAAARRGYGPVRAADTAGCQSLPA